MSEPTPVLNDAGHILPDSVYKVLKPISLVILPSVATLYFTIAQIWGLPAATEVVGTIVAVNTFLGVLLGISSVSYNRSDQRFDGAMVVPAATEAGQAPPARMELNTTPEDLAGKHEVSLKVVQQ